MTTYERMTVRADEVTLGDLVGERPPVTCVLRTKPATTVIFGNCLFVTIDNQPTANAGWMENHVADEPIDIMRLTAGHVVRLVADRSGDSTCYEYEL